MGERRRNEGASAHWHDCGANGAPLDERLGLGHAGGLSRYRQAQCGWRLALLPGRVAQQTWWRFGWPAVSARLIREQGEALGAELDQREQEAQAAARTAAAARGRRSVLLGVTPPRASGSTPLPMGGCPGPRHAIRRGTTCAGAPAKGRRSMRGRQRNRARQSQGGRVCKPGSAKRSRRGTSRLQTKQGGSAPSLRPGQGTRLGSAGGPSGGWVAWDGW